MRDAHAVAEAAVRRQSRGRALAAAALPLATALATVAAALSVSGATGAGLRAPVAALLVLAPFALADVLAPLPDAMRALARAQAADQRLQALLDQAPAVAGRGRQRPGRPADGRPPHLRLVDVSASWDGRRTALQPVTLDLPPGSSVALTGANGCGKSTLLAVLARHLDPAGRYELDGVDVRELDLDAVRALFAVVDDEPHLFASTLRENLRLAAPGAEDSALKAALHAAGLTAWRRGLADGLDTRLGAGGVGVSGGERARIGMARALLSGRPVLLLDEPVAHLDHPTAESVLRDLFAAGSGRTVVLVSHRPEGLEQQGASLTSAQQRPRPEAGEGRVPTKAINKLGDLERAVMEQFWARGEAGEPSVSVREVHAALSATRDLAYTTVMTVMGRLADGGLLVERAGRAFLYTAAGTREELTATTMLGHLHGLPSADRRAAMLHFLGDASAEEIDDLKAALAEVEQRHGRRAAGVGAEPSPGTPGPGRPGGRADRGGSRVMARQEWFRRAPRAALVAWQSVSLSAVVCAVAAAPLSIATLTGETETSPHGRPSGARRQRPGPGPAAVGRPHRGDPAASRPA